MSASPLIDLEHLYRLHAARLRTWARRQGVPPAECEDLVQEIFLQAHRGQTLFRGDSTSLSWLFGIAKRVSVKAWRQRCLRRAPPRFTDILDEIPSDGPSPLESAELRELASMLDHALDLAGAERRRLILAHALGQAAAKGDPNIRPQKDGTRWVSLHRARKKVMALLIHRQYGTHQSRIPESRATSHPPRAFRCASTANHTAES